MKALRQLLVAIAALAAQLGFGLPSASAADPSAPVLLVAAPSLAGAYERTVLLALPAGNGASVGFILNRPTQTSLATLFPEIPAARQVRSPLFIGGPALRESLFALVRSPHAPSEGSVQVLPGLFMAFGSDDVSRVLNRFPERARFYAGLVAWDEGELQGELDAGAWYVLAPDIELVIQGSTDTLWTRLIERVQSIVAQR
jgi:putative transcriptional regulator